MAKKYLPFYNVSQSVGRGGVNQGEDILLIQFFLSEIGRVPPHPLPPPSTPLPVDGQRNQLPLLEEWILWFQKCVRAAGKTVTVDGRVDPASTFMEFSFVNNTKGFFLDTGTMVHMNFTYRRRFKQEHNALEKAASCPAQLITGFTD